MQKQGEANAQKEDTANGLEHAQATANEIISYARHLGIDPTYDADLLWIAEQAYNAPVPENWEEHMVRGHKFCSCLYPSVWIGGRACEAYPMTSSGTR